jgi:hypothetical protein
MGGGGKSKKGGGGGGQQPQPQQRRTQGDAEFESILAEVRKTTAQSTKLETTQCAYDGGMGIGCGLKVDPSHPSLLVEMESVRPPTDPLIPSTASITLHPQG